MRKNKNRNRFKNIGFPEKVMIFFVIFIFGLFLWDITFNGALERTDFVEILKVIGENFGK